MEKKNYEFREPRLRVSRNVYVKVMETVLNEAVFLDPEVGTMLIYAVRAYLQSSRNAPGSGDRVYKLFRRYREFIDRAAERSARARAVALRRREARQRAAEEAAAGMGAVSECVSVSPCGGGAPEPRKYAETPRGHLGGWPRGV